MDIQAAPAKSGDTEAELAASFKILKLPPGTYRITISGGAKGSFLYEDLKGPVLQISPAPVWSEGAVELLSGPGTFDRWLVRSEDSVLAKISGGTASLLLTSIRSSEHPAMAIDIRPVETNAAATATGPGDPDWLGGDQTAPSVPVSILAHLQEAGDAEFADQPVVAPDQEEWIEGFAVSTPGTAHGDLVEYYAVRSDGVTSPWMRAGDFCGSRRMALPLVGYALRIKSTVAQDYECVYGARFASGRSLAALHDGALCRSEFADDPIVSMEVRIFEHRGASVPEAPGGVS